MSQKAWSFKKHALCSVVISLVFAFLLFAGPYIVGQIENSLLGILGSTDGPTVTTMVAFGVMGPSWMSETMIYLSLLVFNPGTVLLVVLLLLYKPVKKFIEKK